MSLRKDVKHMLGKDCEQRVSSDEIILKQAIRQLKLGKSSGDVGLDMKAIKAMHEDKDEDEER